MNRRKFLLSLSGTSLALGNSSNVDLETVDTPVGTTFLDDMIEKYDGSVTVVDSKGCKFDKPNEIYVLQDPSILDHEIIEINADGVTLDLGGHILTGDNGFYGIVSSGFLGVTITNGTLENLPENAISLNECNGFSISNLIASANKSAIKIVGSSGGQISDVTGISQYGHGLELHVIDETLISRTIGNGIFGVYLGTQSGTGNYVELSQFDGGVADVMSTGWTNTFCDCLYKTEADQAHLTRSFSAHLRVFDAYQRGINRAKVNIYDGQVEEFMAHTETNGSPAGAIRLRLYELRPSRTPIVKTLFGPYEMHVSVPGFKTHKQTIDPAVDQLTTSGLYLPVAMER